VCDIATGLPESEAMIELAFQGVNAVQANMAVAVRILRPRRAAARTVCLPSQVTRKSQAASWSRRSTDSPRCSRHPAQETPRKSTRLPDTSSSAITSGLIDEPPGEEQQARAADLDLVQVTQAMGKPASQRTVVDGRSIEALGVDDVATTAWDSYDLVIVAHDTQYESTWSDPNAVAAIADSGRPVVGLGDGGYDFFGLLRLSIGNPYGGHGSKHSIEVIDPNSSPFNTPYSIETPQDRILQLYTETDHVGIYLWPTIPETVTVLGREVNDVGYYPLVVEQNRYMLWGFTESPRKMTEVGKRLFINIVIHTANSSWGS